MSINLIKAWKDEEYRSTLSKSQLSLATNPVGAVELSDDDMKYVNGGTLTIDPSANSVEINSLMNECCKKRE